MSPRSPALLTSSICLPSRGSIFDQRPLISWQKPCHVRLLTVLPVLIRVGATSALFPSLWTSRGHKPERRSQKVGLHDVLLYHALGIEKGAIKCDGVAHDIDEALPVAIEQRQNDLLELVIK